MKKFVSVKDVLPDVDLYWDYNLNAIGPDKVAHRSNKKFFWKCLNGHPSYECSPDKKIYRKYGCPVCSNHKVITGINDFKSNKPLQMLDWDYEKNKDIDPELLSINSNTIVNWKCHTCKHEWKGKVQDASLKIINCPVCSKKKSAEKKHLTALSQNGGITDKNLLLDWDYSKNTKQPSEYSPKGKEYAFWKCHICGYEWKAKINNRSNGRGCPCCANKTVVDGVNDFATKHPDMAKEWHPTKNGDLKPNQVLPGTARKVWWLCPNGHEYQATLNHRTSGNGTNCPICNQGRQTSFREQAIYFYVKQLYPDAISKYKVEWLGAFELDIFIQSISTAIEYDGVAWHKDEKIEREKRKYLLCKKHNIRLIRVKEKMPNQLGLEIADDIISSDNFESINNFTQIIHTVLEKICFKRSYLLNPINVDIVRDRFEILKYATIVKGSLAEKHPELINEWHPTKNMDLKPTMLKPKSEIKVWWKCNKCGYEWETTPAHRVEGTGCPKCSREKQTITRRKNAVAKYGCLTDEKLLREWDYKKNIILPSEITPGSKKKVWWVCSRCNHSWEASINNRVQGRGCPNCNKKKQISLVEKAFVYYLSKHFKDIQQNSHLDGFDKRELDIYIPSLKLAIEYDGSRWHKNYKSDLIKDTICDKKGITLVRIREEGCPIYESTAYFIHTSQNHGNVSLLKKPLNELFEFINKKFNLNLSLLIDIEKDVPIINESYYKYAEENSLAKKYPKLLSEWDYIRNKNLNPNEISFGSQTKVWWKCEKGHE